MIQIPVDATPACELWPTLPGLVYEHRSALGPERGVALVRTRESAFSLHAHAGHRLNLLVEGFEREWCRGAMRHVGPCDLVLVPAEEVHHSPQSLGALRYLTLAFDPDQPIHRIERRLGRALIAPLLWQLVAAVSAEPADALVVESLHAEIEGALGRCVVPAPRDADWLVELVQRVMDDPMGSMSLSEAARSAGVHRCHVARTVRARFGRTFGEILNARRLELAARALVHRSDTIASIAAEFGYYDQSHFGRSFVHAFGATPSAFRSRAQVHPG